MNILFMQSNNIPKEEPKMIDDWLDEHGDPNIFKKVEKQLELEEAAFESSVDYKPFEDNLTPQKYYEYGFVRGAKWQAERSYSLDEIKTAMKNGYGIKYFSEHTFLKNLNNSKRNSNERYTT